MKLRLSLTALTFALVGIFTAMPGNATNSPSIGALKAVGSAQPSGIEKAHGWHRKCRRGLSGWHKHVRGVGRVQCTVAKNCYRNIFGIRVCDWY